MKGGSKTGVPGATVREQTGHEARTGYLQSVAVYLIWGFLPAYWRLLRPVDPATIMAHRILWSFVLLLAWLLLTGKFRNLQAVLKNRRTAGLLAAASLSLAIQWTAYLLAVARGRLVELSLGYYLYPVVLAVLGVIALGERITAYRAAAFIVAAAGIGLRFIRLGEIPPLALALAFSFAVYSLIKKKLSMESAQSVFVETLFMVPFASGYLILGGSLTPAIAQLQGPTTGAGAGGQLNPETLLLLAGGGAATVLTLLLFASGAKRIPVFAIGFLQYISPTIVLLLGIFAYGEKFGTDDYLLFGSVWLALAIYSIPGIKAAAKGLRSSGRT